MGSGSTALLGTSRENVQKRVFFQYMITKLITITYLYHFLALLERSGSFFILDSRLPEIQNCPGIGKFGPFLIYGIFSHSIFVKELHFQCKISIFHQSWKLPEIFWNSGYHLEMNRFMPILTYWASIQLYFCR